MGNEARPLSLSRPLTAYESLDASKLAIRVMHIRHRWIRPLPRVVRESDTFRAHPLRGISATALLLRLAQEGGDLNPFLSRDAVRTGKSGNDPLLNDWGLNHLHLVTNAADRCDDLLLVVVRPAVFYVIDIRGHDVFKEADLSIFETMERNFPELVEPYRIHAVSSLEKPLTGRAHSNLRNNGVMTQIETASGLYMSPGGGMSTSGRSTSAVLRADMWIERVVATLQAQEDEIRAGLSLETQQTFKITFHGIDLNMTATVAEPKKNRRQRRDRGVRALSPKKS